MNAAPFGTVSRKGLRGCLYRFLLFAAPDGSGHYLVRAENIIYLILKRLPLAYIFGGDITAGPKSAVPKTFTGYGPEIRPPAGASRDPRYLWGEQAQGIRC